MSNKIIGGNNSKISSQLSAKISAIQQNLTGNGTIGNLMKFLIDILIGCSSNCNNW